MMRTLIILQARMGSTRLPGKVLLPLMGRPVMAYQIERLSKCQFADGLIVATSNEAKDEPIVELCERLDVPCSRGSEHDVLQRFADAVEKYGPSTVIRSTADCPLADPAVVDRFIDYFHRSGADYVSQIAKRTFPRGMGAEVMTADALLRAAREATQPYEREHVTPYIYLHPELFSTATLENSVDWSEYRLTLDTPQDFSLISHVFEVLYPAKPDFGLQDIIDYLQAHPDVVGLNADIRQKELGE